MVDLRRPAATARATAHGRTSGVDLSPCRGSRDPLWVASDPVQIPATAWGHDTATSPGSRLRLPRRLAYPTGAQPGRWSGRRLAGRTAGAGAAVLVAGSALAVGLQAATPDAAQSPAPRHSGATAPRPRWSGSAAAGTRRATGDDEATAGAQVAKVTPVPVAPVSTPIPAPVASSGGSGGEAVARTRARPGRR